MIDRLAANEIFAMPCDCETITLVKCNHKETEDYLPGMVPIGRVDYDRIDDYVSLPKIELENDTLTEEDRILLKEVFNL
jgi:hypothetical protein